MISASERKAKIEKLKRDRAIKEQERQKREEQAKAARENDEGSRDLIQRILQNTAIHGDEMASGAQSARSNVAQAKTEGQQQDEKRQNLRVHSMIFEIEIQPKKKAEVYNQEVQCEIIDAKKAERLQKIAEDEEEDSEDDDHFEAKMMRANAPLQRRGTHTVQTGLVSANRADTLLAGKLCSKCQADKDMASMEPKTLNKDETKQVTESNDFKTFFESTSRLVERALGQEFKLSKDFFTEDDGEKEKDNRASKGDKLTKKFVFQEKEHLNRAVTSIDWSPSHPELLLASYSKCNEWSMDEADGLINLFSVSLQGRPEMTLTCQYEVTRAMFNPHDPNVIIGATQTGYLLEWDIRAKKEPVSGMVDRRNRSQPIQKSCLAQNGHNHPIYSLSVVGSQNSHNIVSISNDGKMCMWKPKILSDPKDHFYLEISQNLRGSVSRSLDMTGMSAGQSSQNRQLVNAHCIDFAEGDGDKFFVGAEDFNIYQCTLPVETRNPVQTALYGHSAPVTSVNVHPGLSQSERYSEMSELVLSGSMDWTVNLWNPKERSQPLYTFESAQEYVYDVQWSPTHPSVFASCDAEGFVDVWNINRDKETPVVRMQISEKPRPINCIKWSKDGRRMAAGDSQGFLTVLQADQDLYQPQQEDFEKIQQLIQQGK